MRLKRVSGILLALLLMPLLGLAARPVRAQESVALTAWAWGRNNFGELGRNVYTTAAPYGISAAGQALALEDVTAVAAGTTALALTSDGTVWAWGENLFGGIGTGGYDHSPAVRIQVPGLTDVVAIAASAHNLAVKADGTVWAWGANGFGQLGNGTVTTTFRRAIPSPVQVQNLTDVKAVAAGLLHSLALKDDGTVWSWGDNTYYELGATQTGPLSSPIQVGGLSNVKAIAAGINYSLAIKTDGTLWTWGDNYYGQLGLGYRSTSAPRGVSAPTQVKGPNGTDPLTDVVAVAPGGQFTLALKSDGTVWGWGYNGEGELGETTKGQFVLNPTQVPGLANVVAIAAPNPILALTSNGTVWAWGPNDFGQLGNGAFSTNFSATPTQVPGIHGVTAIASGAGFALAIALPAAHVYVTPRHGLPGYPIAFYAVLSRSTDGTRLNGQTLTFKLNGQVVGTATTGHLSDSNEDGAARLDSTLPATMAAGTYPITVEFAGDANTNPGIGVGTLTVGKADTYLYVTPRSGHPGQKVAFFGVLSRAIDHSVKLNGETLTFKLDGTTLGTATTGHYAPSNEDGVARLDYTLPADITTGAHTITVEFAGDADNNPITQNGTLTVSP